MTREELKQEAEEWLCNNLHSANEEDFIKAMVDIAEPREKRIAELENYNKKLLEGDIDKQNKIALLSKKVNDLQKENKELKEELVHAKADIRQLQSCISKFY